MPEFEVTHTILREEHLTVCVTAPDRHEALLEGIRVIERRLDSGELSTADYETGDVVHDDVNGDSVSVRQIPNKEIAS